MKDRIRTVFSLVLGGASLLSVCLAARGQEGLYFKADVGGNAMQETKLTEFFGPVAPGSKVQFDPGFRFGLAAGYDLLDWFAVEGEFGAFANKISSMTGATRIEDAYFDNFPFMLNAKLHAPVWWRVAPYIGAGVGGSISVLDVDHLTLNDITVHGSDSETVFAYQALAGLRFQINKHMGISVEYHYLATDPVHWHAEEVFGTTSDQIRFGHTYTHGASLAFDWRF